MTVPAAAFERPESKGPPKGPIGRKAWGVSGGLLGGGGECDKRALTVVGIELGH